MSGEMISPLYNMLIINKSRVHAVQGDSGHRFKILHTVVSKLTRQAAIQRRLLSSFALKLTALLLGHVHSCPNYSIYL